MQKLNLFSVEERLKELNMGIFTAQNLTMLFGAKKRAIDGFLSYNTKKNKLTRLKKGLYMLKREYVDPYVIANKIYEPSYVSLESALSHYGLIPETVYSITSVTTKATREFEVNGVAYSYQKIKKEAYTGYIMKNLGNEKIFIATPEKALSDYCYFIYLGKRSWNDRTDIKNLDFNRLKQYLELFKKEKLIKFIKKYIKNI